MQLLTDSDTFLAASMQLPVYKTNKDQIYNT